MIPALRVLGPLAAVSLVTATAAAVVVAHPHPAPAATCSALTSAAQYAAAVEATPRDWGADSWTSAKLADGRTLWLLGDTIRPGVFLHSAYVMQDRCGVMALHAAAQLIPDAGTDYFWAVANFTTLHPGGTTVYVTVERIRPTPAPRAIDYTIVGTELAVLDVPDGQQPRFVGRRALPSAKAGDYGVHWGQAVVEDGGWLYVYGNRIRLDLHQWGRSLWLARVRPGQFLSAVAWQYRSGSGWTRDAAKATEVGPWTQGWGSQFTMQRQASGRWVAVMRPFDFLGKSVVAMTAPDPWGPWTQHVLMADPRGSNGDRYAALAHGTLPDGRTLVSVVNCFPTIAYEDPHSCRPDWYAFNLPGMP